MEAGISTLPNVFLILFKLGLTVASQFFLVRALRRSGFVLSKFDLVIFFFLNLEWPGRLIRFPNLITSYVQHFKESRILENMPSFPFSVLDSFLFLFFYGGLASCLLLDRISSAGFWARGLRVVLVLGVCALMYGVYLENTDIPNPLLENEPSDWMRTAVISGLNVILTALFFRLVGRFEHISRVSK